MKTPEIKLPESIQKNIKLSQYIKDLANGIVDATLVIPKAFNELFYTVLQRGVVKGSNLDFVLIFATIPVLTVYSVAAITDAATGYKILRIFTKQKLTIEKFHEKHKEQLKSEDKSWKKVSNMLDDSIVKINKKIETLDKKAQIESAFMTIQFK